MTVEQQLAQALQHIADLQKEVDRLGVDVAEKDEQLLQKDKQIQTKDSRIMSLEAQLSYLLKKVFGKMSEKKHLPVDPQWLNHPSLFPDELTDEEKAAIAEEAAKAEETITKVVTVKAKPARRDLDTTGLPVITEDIYPEGTTDEEGNLLPEYVEIGTESTKRIERRPALNYIHEQKMHKVILRSEAGADDVHVIEPERPLAPVHKCMAGASVLTDQ